MEDLGAWGWDVESNGFLDESSVDYTTSPWTLRESFEIHCIHVINASTGEEVDFIQEEVYTKFKPWVIAGVTSGSIKKLIAQNGINFDHLVCLVALDMPYTIGPDSVCGIPAEIEDTYIMSKTLNPDRRGHSIEYFGKLFGDEKIDWRQRAIHLGLITDDDPPGAEFRVYHPDMSLYCKQDVKVNIKQYHYLNKEWGDWNWGPAYELEKAVAEIITRQSHRGFWFDSELAHSNLKELDILLEERRAIVEPNLPEKPMGKTKSKEYIPSKNQFKKDGTPSAHIIKWCAKHGGVIEDKGEDGYFTELYGDRYKLPIADEPIVKTEPSTITDSTFIKGFLVSIGWKPSQYKERDLTVNTQKQKLTPEKFAETVERYVENTLASPFVYDRCEKLHCRPGNLKEALLKHDLKKPLKVYTNPTLTTGQEKEIDPTLAAMHTEFPYVQQIIEYLTYNHRRNSILGGGLDPDDWDDEDAEDNAKGFLANVRSDKRIPTPADTCGAATGRMLHKKVVNVPRASSLYGANMRGLFGVEPRGTMIQFAFDFSSLEGRIESHYCYRYEDALKVYCNSLIQEKPNDVHTLISKKVTELVGQEFSRQSSKPVKYGCTYGASIERVMKIIGCNRDLAKRIFDAFWEAAAPLADLRAALEKYWETYGSKKFILGLDGRKIMTRSKHALLNSLFQSAGVICAKRTMVYQDKMLKEKNLSVNFWKEDWKNKEYVQQLIAYHDEAQYEMSKSLVTWKRFQGEDIAKKWAEENKDWVLVHTDKGYFGAKSIMNEITQAAVELTNAHYKLNVPLAVDSVYGLNWRDCH